MKKYEKFFKENILSATTEFNTESNSDQDLLRIAIASELSAITLYNELASKTKSEKIKNVLLDVALEEKVHVGEFQALLEDVDKEERAAHEEGAQEIKGL
jgi:rubrerythrin